MLAPDLLGFGASAAPDGLAARRVDGAGGGARSTGSDEPCAVVGNSAGGAVALSLAHARPHAVTKVVAVGSMGHPMTLPAGARRAVGLRAVARRPRAR